MSSSEPLFFKASELPPDYYVPPPPESVPLAPDFPLPRPQLPDNSAAGILQEGLDVLIQRGQEYERLEGERSMEDVVNAFNVVYKKGLTVTEGWMFMVMLKMVRQHQSPGKRDTYVDGANYFALAGEEALNNPAKTTP